MRRSRHCKKAEAAESVQGVGGGGPSRLGMGMGIRERERSFEFVFTEGDGAPLDGIGEGLSGGLDVVAEGSERSAESGDGSLHFSVPENDEFCFVSGNG